MTTTDGWQRGTAFVCSSLSVSSLFQNRHPQFLQSFFQRCGFKTPHSPGCSPAPTFALVSLNATFKRNQLKKILCVNFSNLQDFFPPDTQEQSWIWGWALWAVVSVWRFRRAEWPSPAVRTFQWKENKPSEKPKTHLGSLLWLSRLRSWRCHCQPFGSLLWWGFDPWLGIFRCCRCSQDKKQKNKK